MGSDMQGQVGESCRHVDLSDLVPIAYCTFDRDGVVLEINLAAASMLGKERFRPAVWRFIDNRRDREFVAAQALKVLLPVV